MAFSGTVWGIDIGQSGLKALRGRVGENGSVQAESFDFVEFPKLLSQQDADPDELIRDAIKQFLSRNTLKGDKVAISVSGQSGLARFIKLPPVDDKQLPNLVGYEAKQQIPFDLEDVVWDYQKLPTVNDDEDEFHQTEVGLFAMKRDQVLRLIRPLVDAEVEIDVVQLLPISVYNAVSYDQGLIPQEDRAGYDPNQWHVIFSTGTEASDLVLTNGARIWQRSVPIGGNHFTKQLTTDLKLTFAKAEHTKRTAREAADPRKVFQSMRPVFNDLVTELQRTLGYFGGIEKKAKIKQVIAVGNSLKLPGLVPYLEKNLELPVKRIETFSTLKGANVVDDPKFKDNIFAFPASYGLVLQGLGLAPLRTNLIPREIVQQRLIRSKKPWVTAIAATLLASFAFNYFFHWRAWNSVHMEEWTSAKSSVQQIQQQSTNLESEDAKQLDELKRLDGLGELAVGSADGRLLWLELLKAITASLPVDETLKNGIPNLDERPLSERKEIFIDRIETEYFADVSQWFSAELQEKYAQMQAERAAQQAGTSGAPPAEAPNLTPEPAPVPPPVDMTTPVTPEPPMDGSTPPGGSAEALSGGAWVIEIDGHHFQHGNKKYIGAEYLRKNLLDQLESGKVELPTGEGANGQVVMQEFDVKELGILNPVLINENFNSRFEIHNPKANRKMSSGMPGMFETRQLVQNPINPRPGQGPPNEPKEEPMIPVPRYEFTIQFCWKQIPLRQRLENRKQTSATDQTDVAMASP
jgi:type IV pilus assembly protein PilM